MAELIEMAFGGVTAARQSRVGMVQSTVRAEKCKLDLPDCLFPPDSPAPTYSLPSKLMTPRYLQFTVQNLLKFYPRAQDAHTT